MIQTLKSKAPPFLKKDGGAFIMATIQQKSNMMVFKKKVYPLVE